ncbi:MAG: DUF3419 family protein [Hyphomicrobiales bacterium]
MTINPEVIAQTRNAERLMAPAGRAHHHNALLSRAGLHERMFTWAFKGLVYPQIWEDPELDIEALELGPRDRIAAIASGGCNVMSYLVARPARIDAVDLNRAHVSLVRLKLAAARHLPDYESFYRFFGDACHTDNVRAYDLSLRGRLDPSARDYWEGRDLLGRRRITLFARNFYRYGLLGKFIGMGHLVARLYRRDPGRLLGAGSLTEQRALYEELIAPLFERKLVRWLVNMPVALYGLGIPPAQYEALAGSGRRDMASVLNERLGRLACDFSMKENYFAWQAFGRRYPEQDSGPLPPYLARQNHASVREGSSRVNVHRTSFTRFLDAQPGGSLDCYVLLDAQDWMSDGDLAELWTQITRTARPGARVIFRTAGVPTILPGRVPDAILGRWVYLAERSAELGRRDRSSIYGGFHLYRLNG